MTALSLGAAAQVGPPQATNPNTNNGYGFTQTSGTYVPLSANRTIWQSGLTLATDAVSSAITLPSNFKYNGKIYNSIYISNNGYITFGSPSTATTYTALSTNVTATGSFYDGAVAGFAVNLKNANTTTSEIAYESTGSKFIVQFTDLQGNSASAAQLITFQIQLDSSNNNVSIVYGTCASGTATLTGQVGLKGAESSDMNNRTGSNWTSTAIGTTTTSNCTLGTTGTTTVPASGLTFNFVPGTLLNAPTLYTAIPYTEDFSNWVNGNSTGDLPNATYWRTWPSRGDNSWRASNIATGITGFASSTGWTDNSESTATAIAAPAVAPTARFHSYQVSAGYSGYMDLYVNLSTGGTGNRVISFDYRNQSGTDKLDVLLSTDGGNTFSNIGSSLTTATAWSNKAFTTNSTSSTAIIRFLATSDFGSDDIYIDNLAINVSAVAPSCTTISTPANAATGVSVNPTITWAAASGASSYLINLGTTPGGTNVINNVDVGNVTSYAIPTGTPLNYSTQYYITIFPKNNFGTATGCTETSFTTTTIPCPTVTAPAAAAIGVALTPTITWSAISGATGYRLTVGTTAGGTDIISNQDLGNVLSYTFATPLSSSTKYFYKVNSYNTTSTSASCVEGNFTTLCSAENAPTLSQTFSSYLPSCWSAAKGGVATSSTLTYGTSKWASATGFANTGTNAGVRINLYDANPGDWLISQPINLGNTAGIYRVKYRMAVTSYLGTAVQTTLGSHIVRLIVSTDGGTTWSDTNVIKTYTGAGTYSNTGQTETVNLTGYTGTIKIAFVTTTTSTSPDIDFHVDDFIVEAIPSCFEPTAVVVSNITTTAANLAWTAPTTAPANGYDVYYSTSNSAPTSTTVPSFTGITATSKVLSPLTPSTQYYAWVRSVCSASDKSTWSVVASFMTPCVSVSAVSENFDTTSATGNILPVCWSKIVTGSANAYVQAGTSMSAPNLMYIYASTATETSIVKLPEISNLSSGNYAISFKGRANFTVGGVVQVGYMTDPNNASTFVVLGSYTSTSITAIDNFFLPIVGVPSGVSTLALRHNGNGYSVLLDDVKYDLVTLLSTSESAQVKNNLTVYPNPFADVLNISDVKNVKSVSVIDVAGRLVKTIENPSVGLQLGELKSGMFMIILNMNDGSKQTIKAIKK